MDASIDHPCIRTGPTAMWSTTGSHHRAKRTARRGVDRMYVIGGMVLVMDVDHHKLVIIINHPPLWMDQYTPVQVLLRI